jgi:hypothetical protein
MNLPVMPRQVKSDLVERLGRHMPDWIAKANIEHFKKLLETEKDPRKRAVIERELVEEEAKLAAIKKQGERKQG